MDKIQAAMLRGKVMAWETMIRTGATTIDDIRIEARALLARVDLPDDLRRRITALIAVS